MPGSGVGDGAADSVVLNGSSGPDHVDVSSQGNDVLVSGISPALEISGSEPAADVLR